MRQIQPQSSMQVVEEAPRMWVGMGNVLDTEDLLHLSLVPDADWSRILRRICLEALSYVNHGSS